MRFPSRNWPAVVLTALLAAAGAAAKSHAPTQKTDLDAFGASFLEENHLAGLSVCLIKNNAVVWQRAFGWANIEEKIPAAPDTLFMLASVSKTVTGAALLHLLDQGRFKLDDDISTGLPFKIRNPHFPDVPITFRMLLNHSSSLLDDHKRIDALYVSGDSVEPPLEELVKRFFVPGGMYYEAKNFSPAKPGGRWAYSNMNYVLISYLVEHWAGMSFPAYCRANIFKPLKMKETSWFLAGIDPRRLAFNYLKDSANSKILKRVEHYGWPGYADGCLRTSVSEFANFLRMLLNRGEFEGTRVLRPETVAAAFSPQGLEIGPEGKALAPALTLLDMGLTWHIYEISGRRCLVHTGGGTGGISAFTAIDPSSKSGFVAAITGPASLKFLTLITVLVEHMQDGVR